MEPDGEKSKVYDPHSLGLEVISISGDEAIVRCPFHDDTNPSSTFNIVKGLFHCFACGQSANANQIMMALGGSILRTERERIPRIEKEEKDWSYLLSAKIAYKNSYLRERKVTDAQVERYDIRQFEDGILFPLRDVRGNVVGMQARHYVRRPKYRFYGKRPALWPFENIPHDTTPVFVVEGVFGVLCADRAGVKAVATMSASSIHDALLYLQGRKVVAIFDDDYAGYLGMAKFILAGFYGASPTFVADEADTATWRRYVKRPTVTRRVLDYAEALPKEERPRFKKILERFNKSLDL